MESHLIGHEIIRMDVAERFLSEKLKTLIREVTPLTINTDRLYEESCHQLIDAESPNMSLRATFHLIQLSTLDRQKEISLWEEAEAFAEQNGLIPVHSRRLLALFAKLRETAPTFEYEALIATLTIKHKQVVPKLELAYVIMCDNGIKYPYSTRAQLKGTGSLTSFDWFVFEEKIED